MPSITLFSLLAIPLMLASTIPVLLIKGAIIQAQKIFSPEQDNAPKVYAISKPKYNRTLEMLTNGQCVNIYEIDQCDYNFRAQNEASAISEQQRIDELLAEADRLLR